MLQYKPKTNGIVLIATLIFMQLILILGLYVLQLSAASVKLNTAYWLHSALFTKATERLKVIENSNLFEETCQIETMTNSELISKDLNWWRINACILEVQAGVYYHVIETLNSNYCINLADSDVFLPIIYLRITLIAYRKNKLYKEMLQSIVVRLDNTKRDCVIAQNQIQLGRQSLRRL